MIHNPKYQAGENGPLTPETRKRIETAKNKLNWTLAEVGDKFGFSGPFVSTLLRSSNPGRIRTKHIERVIDALEKMEVEAGIRTAVSAHGQSGGLNSTSGAGISPDPSLGDLIRAAHKLGFEVSFKPIGPTT